jgi:SAM-dependent methyltransferase/uncharacterized protein YbaR (Trm112 family)
MATVSGIIEGLVCPRDHSPLEAEGNTLRCTHGHVYPVVESVPVMLLDEQEQTIGIARASLTAAKQAAGSGPGDDPYFVSTLGIRDDERSQFMQRRELTDGEVDPVASFLVAATNGILYQHLKGKLKTYPIPTFRLPPGGGRRLLDVGCNWGRWCVAAGQSGYRPVGLDPSLGAVLAARRICKRLGIQADFVVGDGRFLPFANGAFDNVFSYSVIQHFDKKDAERGFAEAARVLAARGSAFIQMPNVFGVRCLYHQIRRGFRQAREFEVRYWTPRELRLVWERYFGDVQLSVDCYFGIGLQPSDMGMMPPKYRTVIKTSEWLRHWSESIPMLRSVADSLYVSGIKR